MKRIRGALRRRAVADPEYPVRWDPRDLRRLQAEPSVVHALAVDMDVSPWAVLCAYATLVTAGSKAPAVESPVAG